MDTTVTASIVYPVVDTGKYNKDASPKHRPLECRYRDYGSLVAMGRYSTVGSLMGGLAGSMMVSASSPALST